MTKKKKEKTETKKRKEKENRNTLVGAMSFQEFGNKLNTEREFLKSYIQDPVTLVKQHLKIDLTPTQEQELVKAAEYLKTQIPDKRFFIPGVKYDLTDKPILH